MKGIVDLEENIKTKKTYLKDRCGKSMDPPNPTKELLKLFDG